jgi:hypothetical protein
MDEKIIHNIISYYLINIMKIILNDNIKNGFFFLKKKRNILFQH